MDLHVLSRTHCLGVMGSHHVFFFFYPRNDVVMPSIYLGAARPWGNCYPITDTYANNVTKINTTATLYSCSACKHTHTHTQSNFSHILFTSINNWWKVGGISATVQASKSLDHGSSQSAGQKILLYWRGIVGDRWRLWTRHNLNTCLPFSAETYTSDLKLKYVPYNHMPVIKKVNGVSFTNMVHNNRLKLMLSDRINDWALPCWLPSSSRELGRTFKKLKRDEKWAI